eukprot:3941156-Rhodomonas_salina.4
MKHTATVDTGELACGQHRRLSHHLLVAPSIHHLRSGYGAEIARSAPPKTRPRQHAGANVRRKWSFFALDFSVSGGRGTDQEGPGRQQNLAFVRVLAVTNGSEFENGLSAPDVVGPERTPHMDKIREG